MRWARIYTYSETCYNGRLPTETENWRFLLATFNWNWHFSGGNRVWKNGRPKKAKRGDQKEPKGAAKNSQKGRPKKAKRGGQKKPKGAAKKKQKGRKGRGAEAQVVLVALIYYMQNRRGSPGQPAYL